MKIELKNIAINHRMSQETLNYIADLYVDGKKVGEVGNAGHGGCDDQRVYPYSLLEEINNWCKANLPPISMKLYGMDDIPCDLEAYCGILLERYEVEKRVKRDLKNKIMFVKQGETAVWEIPLKSRNVVRPEQVVVDYVEKTYPNAIILNRLPFEKAVELFNARPR